MDHKQAKLVQVLTAYREKAGAEIARRAGVDAQVAAGAVKAASALVASGVISPARQAEAEASLRDPVKAQGLIVTLAKKLAKATAAPEPIGAPAAPVVAKTASAGDDAAARQAKADAAWAQALSNIASR